MVTAQNDLANISLEERRRVAAQILVRTGAIQFKKIKMVKKVWKSFERYYSFLPFPLEKK